MLKGNSPRYCKACAGGNWTVVYWKRGDVATKVCLPYKCHSWRHEGECSRWKAAQDFARISEAMLDGSHWVCIVLTFYQSDWKDKGKLYKAGGEMWSVLRKRFVRKWGPIKYIQTWERHVAGGAHVNLVVSNKSLYDEIQGPAWWGIRQNWLIPNAVACGFGEVDYIEPVRDKYDMARYLNRLSKELTAADKKDQVPWDAPPHFRRLRSTQGILKPVIKSEDYTGRMLFEKYDIAMVLEKMCDENGEVIESGVDGESVPG